MSTPTAKNLALGLGCVVHDMQLLAAALLVANQPYAPRDRARVRHRKRIASEMIFLKSRSLLEFLAPKAPRGSDIQVHDFGLPPANLAPPLDTFWSFVSKRSSHLTWERAKDPLLLWHEIHGVTAPQCGYDILLMAESVVNTILSSGIQLVTVRHHKRRAELAKQLSELRSYFPAKPEA